MSGPDPVVDPDEHPCWQHPYPPAGHDTVHDGHQYPASVPGLTWQCPGRATVAMFRVRQKLAAQVRECAHPQCGERIERGETYARVTTDGRTQSMHLECAMAHTGGGPTESWWTR